MNPLRYLTNRRKRLAQREAERRHDCPRCNPTARAIRWVQDKWVVAGIDLGE